MAHALVLSSTSPRGAASLALLGAALLAGVGCSDPPLRVATRWADEARAVRSPDTPGADDPQEAMARWINAEGEEEDGRLEDLHLEQGVREVWIELPAGVFVVESAVLLSGPTVHLTGEGPHLTRLEFDTESMGSLLLQGAPRVELRGLTLVGLTGGGLRIKGCPEVEVTDLCVAGARWGLDLSDCTARVTSSVFAGCQQGIVNEGGKLEVSETAFDRCWTALDGDGRFDVTSSAFLENREAVKAHLDGRSRLIGNVFVGEKQELDWRGRPEEFSHNLVHEGFLGRKVGKKTNRPINLEEDFPDALKGGLPGGLDLVAVDLTLLRARNRGKSDPPKRLEQHRQERARTEAIRAQRAAREGQLDLARQAARNALRYLGDCPLSDAPREVVEVGGLAE